VILKNIEIKAKIANYKKIVDLVEHICPEPPEIENQVDTFFNAPRGRLKLRETARNSVLIYYDRPDAYQPKFSDIIVSTIENPKTLKKVLSKSIGIRGIVEKNRKLYKYEQTRIHLDNVKGLGRFIELEVVLKKNQPKHDGEKIAHDLMHNLEIHRKDLIKVAYIDF